MYNPKRWPYIAEELANYHDTLWSKQSSTNFKRVKPNITTLRRAGNSTNTGNVTSSDIATSYSFQGITCADAIDTNNVTTKDVFDMLVSTTRNVSPMFGPIWGDAGSYCHHWPVRAVERFTGPWNKTLSNTIIVIGNEADPITPLAAAKSVADALGDSAVLIEQDDYGVCVTTFFYSSAADGQNRDSTPPLRCIQTAALQDYFLTNKLPTQDIFCGTNQVLFPTSRGNVTKATVAEAKAASKIKERRLL
ncbi:hypothetical protein RSOLAG1IB_09207 [Rhizoctonia solani AG-1 IB]|uniref:Peptidase S33 tripeptidyl aminopeptidase-like C-terminal domain-containing protein n=1 Tax=Thanatephorus cucumeris (strain AG1-IB / isolate 7/3/14) TaxID=1108050 RepID=A0A0B7FUK1_THACB|nr:hypothetical protein RSOLAG1IB_09207 [Rhizoctonia solani AG-1 IB]